jgi:hypothetical protein
MLVLTQPAPSLIINKPVNQGLGLAGPPGQTSIELSVLVFFFFRSQLTAKMSSISTSLGWYGAVSGLVPQDWRRNTNTAAPGRFLLAAVAVITAAVNLFDAFRVFRG